MSAPADTPPTCACWPAAVLMSLLAGNGIQAVLGSTATRTNSQKQDRQGSNAEACATLRSALLLDTAAVLWPVCQPGSAVYNKRQCVGVGWRTRLPAVCVRTDAGHQSMRCGLQYTTTPNLGNQHSRLSSTAYGPCTATPTVSSAVPSPRMTPPREYSTLPMRSLGLGWRPKWTTWNTLQTAGEAHTHTPHTHTRVNSHNSSGAGDDRHLLPLPQACSCCSCSRSGEEFGMLWAAQITPPEPQ